MSLVKDLAARLTEISTRELNSSDAVFFKKIARTGIDRPEDQVATAILRMALQRKVTGVTSNCPMSLLALYNSPSDDQTLGILESTEIPLHVDVVRYNHTTANLKFIELKKEYVGLSNGEIRTFANLLPIDSPDDVLYGLQTMYALLLDRNY